MNILLLFTLFTVFELFESSWQKSSTLYGLINNNFYMFKKNIFLYFLVHPTFFYSIFLSIYLNNFGFLMSSIIIVKFCDIAFKLSIMKNLSNGKDISAIIPMNIHMTPIFRYMNLVIYPITFIFAVYF